MVTLRDLHRYQTARSMVQLEDGRVGKIVRVDTTFPGNCTEVSVYTVEIGRSTPAAPVEDDEPVAGGTQTQPSAAPSREAALGRAAPDGTSAGTGGDADPDEDSSGGRVVSGPGIARVSLDRIVGLAKVSG